jgi:nucleoside-diphosphate-sugar epimerase
MKCLIIGGNRFVGLRLSLLLEALPEMDLHILNRTGQAPHCKSATVYKGDRRSLPLTHLDREWDVIIDFATFNAAEAKASVEYFTRVGRYIFVSSISVYDHGVNLREEQFDPKTWNLQQAPEVGKRHAEAFLHQLAKFPVVSVRFPFILGPDDYTGRLKFHVDHAKSNEPIYVPNPKALISMIDSEDAARALAWLAESSLTGPLNVASPKPISLHHLFGQIQLVLGHEPVFADIETPDNHSPYGVAADLAVNIDRLEKAGFKTRPLLDWLPQLIGEPQVDGSLRLIH